MIDRKNILDELIAYLDQYKYLKKIVIDPNTEIHADLGICGMDFMEILLWMEKRFGIIAYLDCISKHCPPDDTIIYVIVEKILLIFGIKIREFESLKVSDLADAVQAGRWPT